MPTILSLDAFAFLDTKHEHHHHLDFTNRHSHYSSFSNQICEQHPKSNSGVSEQWCDMQPSPFWEIKTVMDTNKHSILLVEIRTNSRDFWCDDIKWFLMNMFCWMCLLNFNMNIKLKQFLFLVIKFKQIQMLIFHSIERWNCPFLNSMPNNFA